MAVKWTDVWFNQHFFHLIIFTLVYPRAFMFSARGLSAPAASGLSWFIPRVMSARSPCQVITEPAAACPVGALAVRNNPAGVKACGERGCRPTSAATQPGAIFLTPRKSTRKSPRHGAVWNVISLCDLDSGRIWKSIHCNAHNSDGALVAI